MMVIKLYISGISGNKEVKKKQQRVQMILDSKQISYEAIDITEPGKEKDKEFMQQNGKVRESLGKYPLPPQIFNDEDFCGDYEDFDLANEVDELEKFLHIETNSKEIENGTKQDEESRSSLQQPSNIPIYNPYEYHTFKIKYDGVNGLKEQIINGIDLKGENEQTEEVTKSEVNGESEAVPTIEPSSEKVTENIETSPEEVALEKEETSAEENKASTESEEKEKEENAEEKHDEIEEEEAEEKEEEEEEGVENPKEEDNVESPNKELSSPPEENETDIEKDEEKEENENESDDESAQSEKSQED